MHYQRRHGRQPVGEYGVGLACGTGTMRGGACVGGIGVVTGSGAGGTAYGAAAGAGAGWVKTGPS